MELVGMQESISEKLTRDRKKNSLRITNRDLELLEFVLEMKFASLSDIHSKFFRFMKDGTESNSLWWAYERLRRLVKFGFLIDGKSICNEKLFLVSEHGYYFLRNSNLSKEYCRPVHSVDIRTFNHDSTINKVRVDLENYRKVTGWQSERALTEDPRFRSILTKEFRPDGIYLDVDGARVAFEMEISQKANVRYDNKIHKFLQIMQSERKLRLFDRVHYVCANECVLEKLKDKTQLFKSLFKVESVTEINQEQPK